MSKVQYLFAAIISCLTLPGCESSNGTPATEFAVSIPDRLAQNVDESALSVNVTIDGRRYQLNRGINGSQWVGNFALPTDRQLALSVEWYHDYLLLARYENTLAPITDPIRLEVSADQYLTTGVNFDADSDGTSNLAEIQNRTNPTDAQDIDLLVPKLRVGETVGVNGATGVTWDSHQSYEWNTTLPAIDNQMSDRGAIRDDGDTEFYWQAVHNGTFLFVIVYGESIDRGLATPIRDSHIATRDDAVRLYFDGNNSKLNYYDGVDDLHITMPLLTKRRAKDEALADLQPVVAEDGDYIFDDQRHLLMGDVAAPSFVEPAAIEANDIDLANAEWQIGPAQQTPDISLDGFDFSNGIVSQGSQVYEFKIPLAGLGIQVGQPFGFEVQIFTDHNGGNSDARYGWRHPSRTNASGDIDYTAQNPSYFGTLLLED